MEINQVQYGQGDCESCQFKVRLSLFLNILQTKLDIKHKQQMNSTKVRQQIAKYDNQDFKNLYRQVKCLSLLNQLYDSDSITKKDFEEEESEILGKFKRLKAHLSDQDLDAFAKLYNIEKQMKRFAKENFGTSDKQLLSLVLTLGSKFPELQDTIHTSKETREVKDVINILAQITLLLAKYIKLAKKINPDLIAQIQKLNKIFAQCKKKNINEQFTAMEYYELEDAVQKLWLQFNNS